MPDVEAPLVPPSLVPMTPDFVRPITVSAAGHADRHYFCCSGPTLEAGWRSLNLPASDREATMGSRADVRPKCLRVSAPLPFGGEAGLGAPLPEIPCKDPRAS